MALVTMALAFLGTIAGTASATTPLPPPLTSSVAVSPTSALLLEGTHMNVTLTRTLKSSADADATWVRLTVPTQAFLAISNIDCDLDEHDGVYEVSFAALSAGSRPQICVLEFDAVPDNEITDDRPVSIALSAKSGTQIAPTTLLTTVRNDDMTFSMVDTSKPATEGRDFDILVHRTGATAASYAMQYSCSCSWLSPSLDYAAAFGPGIDDQVIHIEGANTEDDNLQPEHATFTIVDPLAAAGHETTDVVIQDNDSIARMGETTVDADRSTGARIPVVREGNLTASVTIPYTVTPVTAREGRDYEGASGTLTIPANHSSVDLNVPLKPDDATTPRTFKVAFAAGAVANDGDSHAGSTILKDDLSATVAIAAMPPKHEDPKRPEEPKGPEDPPHITAQIKLLTKVGKGGAEYVALPKAKSKVYVGLKLKTDKAIAAGTKIRLVGKGLTFGGDKAAQSVMTVASLIPADGGFHTAGAALAARTTSKDLVTITPVAVDDAVSVAGTKLSLKAPTNTVLLKLPEPVSRSKDHDKDLVTWFTGTYSAPTCGAELSVFYYVQGGWHDAQVPLKSSTVAGICQFAGKIRWEPGILNYAHIKVRVKLGKRFSRPVTLKIKRNR